MQFHFCHLFFELTFSFSTIRDNASAKDKYSQKDGKHRKDNRRFLFLKCM